MLMHQLLIDGANRHPDRTALVWIDRDKSVTYAEAVLAMDRYAGMLHHLGIQAGDRVTVFAHNGMDYLLSLFACWRIGAIPALVNVQLADELAYYVADHDPSVIVYTHDQVDAVRKAAANQAKPPVLVCMDGAQEGAESLPDLVEAAFAPPPDPLDDQAIAHLAYTSGTTGQPKGACLRHEPTMRATGCIAERLRIEPGESSFGPTALSSSYQLVGNLLPPLHRGCTVNVMGRWSAESGWSAIDKAEASLFVGNPTLLLDILTVSNARGRKPGCLRLGMSGGAPVPPTLKARFRDELGIPLVESCGQSELGGFVALAAPEFPSDDNLTVIGRPLPDKEVRILDSDGRELPIGEVGEICVRGGFMAGYWNREEKTAEALRDGWLHTDDAGMMNADGMVTMRGRFSELIRVGETTWFPRDTEEALMTMPGIREAAVIGIPDSQYGHRPIAFATTDGEVDGDKLRRHLICELEFDFSMLEIRFIDEFPMTSTGKIAKAALRDQVMAE